MNMSRSPIPDTIRAKLFILVMMVALPCLALILYGNLEQRRNEKRRVREAAMAVVNLAAAGQQNFVNNTRQTLATLTEFPFLVLTTNREFCSQNLANFRKLSPDYLNFGLLETDGTVFSSAEPLTETVNLRDRLYFQLTRARKKFCVGEFQIGRLTREPGLNFGYPVLDKQGQLTRVIFASLKLSRLSSALRPIQLPQGAALFLLDRNGKVLACQPDKAHAIGQSISNAPLFQKMSSLKERVFEMPGVDGLPRLHAVTAISDDSGPGLYLCVAIPSKVSFARANAVLARNLAILAATAALVLLAAHYYSTRFFLRPVARLANAARRLADGDLSARAGPIQSVTELNQLGTAFDEMAGRLQTRQGELKAANDKIVEMNRELERRVAERTAQLEAANKELEAFSYSVSHDLRAPLRHIEGYAGLLREVLGSDLPPDGARYLKTIGQSSREMSRLIDDLLHFSRMSRTEIRVTDCPLDALFNEVIQSLQPEMRERRIDWTIDALPQVKADPALLRQVCVNLLSNDIKYTRTRATAAIHIGCTDTNGAETVVFVRDNGVGFDMAYAEKLFGVFQRLHLDDEFEGTGIGLAHVQRIIAKHGGRVWAQAKLNEGATFYFSLPRSAAAPDL